MKSKKKTKVPAYAFGTQFKEIGSNMLENAPDVLNTLITPFQKSNATTGGQAVAQSIGDITSGAATGFKVAGPVGAAVGAGIGLIGRSGEQARMTSFTDYDEGSLGSGLIGAFGNRRLRRKRAAIKKNAYSNRAAVQGTNYLQSEAYDDMIGMNTDTMANGGVSSSLAYVDDGELIQTPDGSISKVPENNKPTDSNLVSLPEGSRVLSDKLKVPGRKETFAQLGEKMMAKKKSKYNDRFAENAAKLNEMNNNMIHDQLFAMQESVKQSKGIKPKTKQIQAAALGDEIKPGLGDRKVGSALSGIVSLIPIMSNLFTGRPKTVDAVYNPYATSISNTMRRRRYDISPAIEDLNRNRATSNYNASQINTSTGANLAYRLQSAVNTDRAIASLRSQESNVNNQYLGDYANTMNSLGQQWVNATNMANEANAQNRGTARDIRRTGLSQLSLWAQNRELMRNQNARDIEMWPLYQRFLQAGFTEDDLRAMMNSNRSTIKRKGGK